MLDVRATIPAAVLACAISTSAATRAQPVLLEDVLRDAATYLERYERDVIAVVAQEDYRQGVSGTAPRARRLKSEVLFFADASGWVEFRDVFEVDGEKVRDHDDRLMRLFLEPHPDARQQALRIVEESARFNVSPPNMRFSRTLNVPMTALRFLRRENQARSSFRLERIVTLGARRVAIVRFTERVKPTLIGSKEDLRAEGGYEIDVGSGRVAQSDLVITTKSVVAKLKVEFAEQAALGLWLPAVMEEGYELQTGAFNVINGRATYSNYRQFKVATETTIK